MKEPIESSRKVELLGLLDKALLQKMKKNYDILFHDKIMNIFYYLLPSRNIFGIVPPMSWGPPASVGVYRSAVFISLEKPSRSFSSE